MSFTNTKTYKDIIGKDLPPGDDLPCGFIPRYDKFDVPIVTELLRKVARSKSKHYYEFKKKDQNMKCMFRSYLTSAIEFHWDYFNVCQDLDFEIIVPRCTPNSLCVEVTINKIVNICGTCQIISSKCQYMIDNIGMMVPC